MKGIKLPKIDWANHIIGFISILFGVLLAFWLSDWNEGKKEQKRINSALKNLQMEIKDNQLSCDSAYTTNTRTFDYMGELAPYLNDSLIFRDFDDTIEVIAIYKKYYGEDTEVSNDIGDLEIHSLNSAAYETFTSINAMSYIDFDLAVAIQRIYVLQEKMDKLDNDLIDEAKRIKDMSDLLQIRSTLRISNDIASELLDSRYPTGIKRIEEYLEEHAD